MTEQRLLQTPAHIVQGWAAYVCPDGGEAGLRDVDPPWPPGKDARP